jgi:hypothetical protein
LDSESPTFSVMAGDTRWPSSGPARNHLSSTGYCHGGQSARRKHQHGSSAHTTSAARCRHRPHRCHVGSTLAAVPNTRSDTAQAAGTTARSPLLERR